MSIHFRIHQQNLSRNVLLYSSLNYVDWKHSNIHGIQFSELRWLKALLLCRNNVPCIAQTKCASQKYRKKNVLRIAQTKWASQIYRNNVLRIAQINGLHRNTEKIMFSRLRRLNGLHRNTENNVLWIAQTDWALQKYRLLNLEVFSTRNVFSQTKF